MEKPVTFKNNARQTLFGILHIPEISHESGLRIGINILNPGLKNRVAPNRLNVKIARMLCDKGFFVFRFDPSGIGDSEGNLPDQDILDIWGSIQKARFVEDTLFSNNYFIKKCSLNDLILVGNCGGAITAYLAGAIDKRVTKLILIDLPVIISTSNRTFKDRIISSDETANKALKGYIFNTLTRPKSWIKFLCGQSEYSTIWTIIKKKMGIKMHNNQNLTYDDIYCNKSIPINFKRLISRKVKISFILAQNDSGTQIFCDRFEKPYLSNNSKARDLTDVLIINNANHIYASRESQKILLDYITNTFK